MEEPVEKLGSRCTGDSGGGFVSDFRALCGAERAELRGGSVVVNGSGRAW
jgi:hypothetical protein